MRILSVISTLNPAAGGPAECCVVLNRMFRRLGHRAEVLSCDGGTEEFLKRFDFKTFAAGPPYLRYSYAPRLHSILQEIKRDFDGIILHGMWQYQSLAALRAFRRDGPPFVLFPHGNLDPYFIHNFPLKHIKKNAHYRLIESALFRRAQAVLFTCREERRLASTSYQPVVGNHVTIRYGIDPPEFDAAQYQGPFRAVIDQLSGKHLLLFFGRIHPKKGCDLLIEAFAKTAHLRPDAHLLMVGPDETAWVPRLQANAAQLGIADRISWLGPAYGPDKWFLYSSANVFVLPSHMENFGIAIAEAMSRRVAALISDKINIHTEITAAGAGISDVDTVAGTENLLKQWFALSPAEQLAMGERAHELVQQRYLSIDAARDILQIFADAQRGADPLNVPHLGVARP